MLFSTHSMRTLACACITVVAVSALAVEPTIKKDIGTAPAQTAKASYAPGDGADTETLIFTAAPRETLQDAQAIYTPIAAYLTQVIGRKVVYRHPGTWGAYRSEMLNGEYDIVFDGPHFNSYRVERLNHNILVKLPGRHEFAIIVRKDDKFTSVSQLGGRTFCTHAPPNLGALVLLSQFDNPSRQPSMVPTDGWDKIYEGVVAGRCTGGILPMANLGKLNKNEAVKIIHKTPALPNLAFSAGPRVSAEQQTKIVAALTVPEAAAATAKLRTAFKADQFVTASNAEYAGIAQYLRNEWGYY